MGEIEKTSFKEFFELGMHAILIAEMQSYRLYRLKGVPQFIKPEKKNGKKYLFIKLEHKMTEVHYIDN